MGPGNDSSDADNGESTGGETEGEHRGKTDTLTVRNLKPSQNWKGQRNHDYIGNDMESGVEVIELQNVDASLRENIDIPDNPLGLAKEDVRHGRRESMCNKNASESDQGVAMGLRGRNTRVQGENTELERAEGGKVEHL